MSHKIAIKGISSIEPIYKERREVLLQKEEKLNKKLSESKKSQFHHIPSTEELLARYSGFITSEIKLSRNLGTNKFILNQLETKLIKFETLEHP
ncbi:MAG: hypothetical protein LBS15_02940, partial [Endomicrobium sp.]|nr:hypothetical protein [Endomicrobium sp.]